MKKFMLLSLVLFVFAGCSKDDTTSGDRPQDQTAQYVPHFYGAAMLENPAPSTRGVADQSKIWSKPFAERLTVKFLNGLPAYQEYVKETVKEWEKYAGVHFEFLNDNQEDAMVRVGFDYVPGMMSSWALTGTDHMEVFTNQTEPTVHFAQWRRASNALKRSDVLRAFGQVLGLELEFRHPDCYPVWITDENGNIDEAEIRTYWENELGNYISWEELKKMVLDPLADHTFFISKTAKYDEESVMNWPFYEEIAHKLPVIEFETDLKTELSVNDKNFIKDLYGEPLKELSDSRKYLPLITFDYSGESIQLELTTSKNLALIWDWDADEYTPVTLPDKATPEYTVKVDYTFKQSKPYKVTIAEVLESGEETPAGSDALLRLDLTSGKYASNIDIWNRNDALKYFRFIGGSTFTPQEFIFNNFRSLKEIYLVRALNSTVRLVSCRSLEVFATSTHIVQPDEIQPRIDLNAISDPIFPPLRLAWPMTPETEYSVSSLAVANCTKLNTICLENTKISTIDFSRIGNLEYIYLSSEAQFVVNGLSDRLLNALSTIPDRTGKFTGKIVLRSIDGNATPTEYIKTFLPTKMLNEINAVTEARNWEIYWKPGYMTHIPFPAEE